MGRNSSNQDDCCQTTNVGSVYTNFIGNPNGPFQIFDDVLPISDNVYSIGSNALRWQNGYYSLNVYTPQITSSTADLILEAATGFNIIPNKSIVPNVDATHSCGTPSKRWLNVRTVNMLCDTVLTPTGSDLLLSPATGQIIKNTVTIQPLADITTDLGTGSFRYANIYGQTVHCTTINNTTFNTTTISATTGNITNVNATTVNATVSQNLSLTAGVGFVVTSNQDIQPTVDVTKNLGSATKRWQNTYSNSVTSTTISTSGIVTNSVSANPTVDLNISADPGKSIVLNTQTLPVTDNTVPLGSATKQWSDIRANQSTIANINSTTLTMNNTITTPTGIDLNLTAATGRNVVASQTLRPAQDITQNCGSTTERWLNVHGQTVTSSTLTSPTGSNLTITTPSGQIVVISRNARPDTDITRTLGTSTVRWLTVYTQDVSADTITSPTGSNLTITTPTGQIVVIGRNARPDTDITRTLGTSTIRWLTLFTQDVSANTVTSPTGVDLTLNAATGQNILAAQTFRPAQDITHSCGSTATRWLNTHSQTVTTSTITTPTGQNLNLDAATGQNIIASKSLIPNTTATHNLGSTLITWNNAYIANGIFTSTSATTATVTTLNSPAATDLTLDPPTGKDVVSTKSIRPSVYGVHSLGTVAYGWLSAVIDNITTNIVTATNFYKSPADKQGTQFFTSPLALLSDTSYATAAITISAVSFQGGSNSFQFPTTGVYLVDFTSKGDIDTGAGNTITYRLKNTYSLGVTEDQFHRIGDAVTYPPPTLRMSFLFRCNDATNDRIIIERYRSSANVSNWGIVEGYCYRVNTFT